VGVVNTAGGSFKTIQKAISLIPKIVNHPVNINLSAGTYPEAVLFEGFSGGSVISVNGAATTVATHMINSLRIHECNIQIVANGLTATTTSANGFTATRSNGLLLARCTISAASNYPGVFADSSFVQLGASCSISNRDVAINAHVNAIVFSQGTTGTGNNVAFTANYGSRISYSTPIPAATNTSSVNEGGMVTPTGGVINPWGDNTWTQRPASRAITAATQPALSPSVWTKVQFGNKIYDNLGNYDWSLYRFTVPQTGIYQINTNVTFLNPTDGSACEVFLYANGAGYRRFGYAVGSYSASLCLSGSAAVQLVAGTTLEIYARSNSATTLSNGYDNNFEVVRIA
jgi:hypothetical protein